MMALHGGSSSGADAGSASAAGGLALAPTADPTALLVKWLLHDFATPIATMMTASELLGPVADEEINGLVHDAAKRLGARLRLVRAALAPGEAPMGAAALERLLRDGLDGTPVDWQRAPQDTDGATAAMIAGSALLLADIRRDAALTITDRGVRWGTPSALPETVGSALVGAPATDSRSALAARVVAATLRAGHHLTATADGLAWA